MASSRSDNEDIELSRLHRDEDEEANTAHRHQAFEDDDDASSDESDLELIGETALLTANQRGRTKGIERSASRGGKVKGKQKLWPQVKSIVVECAPTLLLTTIGLLFTGQLLNHISAWPAMREIDQLIMIIPVILNLKGNLEMNLSARLGTSANVGDLDDQAMRKQLVLGNLYLLQVQAAVVSFVAAGVSEILAMLVPRPVPEVMTEAVRELIEVAWLGRRRPRPALPVSNPQRKFSFATYVMVTATSMCSAALSSALLGTFMCFLIIMCRKFGLDPDNIAPAIASCLGDLVTLSLLGLVSSILVPFLHTPVPGLAILLVTLIAIACLLALRRESLSNDKNDESLSARTRALAQIRPLITSGWSPLFGAMVISSGTGIVLDLFVQRYEGFGLLAVVISGLPGSVGAIFVSRLSTEGHRKESHDQAVNEIHIHPGPSTSAIAAASTDDVVSAHGAESSGPYSSNRKTPKTPYSFPKTPGVSSHSTSTSSPSPNASLSATTLLLTTIPIQLVFLLALHILSILTLPPLFLFFLIFFFLLAVASSLLLGYGLTRLLWDVWRLDPDVYALPVHSAFMDLIGQSLLVACYEVVGLLSGGKIGRVRTSRRNLRPP